MDKQHIINEIIRTALENNNIPLGIRQFEKETGVEKTDWYGKHWAKWGDAVSDIKHLREESLCDVVVNNFGIKST